MAAGVNRERGMRIGVVLPIADEDADGKMLSYAAIREIALAAEAAGFDSVWVFDHLLFRFDGEESGIHECWTILAAVAEATRRVELGTLVMCTGFRNAALLAKMAATLDHVSGGRLILGLGAGWHDPEYEAFGYPTNHKVGRFEEALAVITGLIREGRADLDGRYETVRDAVLLPPARPGLPILVAAKGPRMLGLTARHADAWNLAWFGRPDERLARVRGELAAACARVGRDPATLAITVGVTVRYPAVAPALGDAPEADAPEADAPEADAPEVDATPPRPGLSGTPEEVAAGLRAHADAGADHLIASLEPCTPVTLAAFAQAVGRFRAG
jgi:alkanesulfonate monooxygenase SsuD/methylene tetrahydromethanopterin reductase-like flavin-dependent oxidoreductase (luciferase family)